MAEDAIGASGPVNRRGRLALYAVAILLAGAGLAMAATPYRARGSRLHAGAFTAAVTDCADDDAEAVADHHAQPGAQDRCRSVAYRRMSVSAVLLLPLAGLVVLDVRRHLRSRRGIDTGVPYYP